MFKIWFRTIGFMKNISYLLFSCCRQFNIVKSKKGCVPETDNYDTFSMLRNPMLTVNNFVVNLIPEILLKRTCNYFKRMAFVMRFQILHVFQNKYLGLLLLDNSGNIEKQGPLCFVFKSGSTAKRVFLGNTSNREWLTGKSGKENIMVRNIGGINLGDIAMN